MGGGVDADGQGEDQRHEEARHAYFQSRRPALQNLPHGGLARDDGLAKIALGQLAHVNEILPPQRPIEPIAHAQFGFIFRRGVLTCD